MARTVIHVITPKLQDIRIVPGTREVMLTFAEQDAFDGRVVVTSQPPLQVNLQELTIAQRQTLRDAVDILVGWLGARYV